MQENSDGFKKGYMAVVSVKESFMTKFMLVTLADFVPSF